MDRKSKFLLLCFDGLILLFCLCLMAYLGDQVPRDKTLSSVGAWFMTVTLLLLFYVFGAYDLSPSVSFKRLLARTGIAVFVALVLIVVGNYFGAKERAGIFNREILLGSFAIFFVSNLLIRWVLIQFLKRFLKNTRWLFICTAKMYETITQDFKKNQFHGQFFFVLDDLNGVQASHRVLGVWQDLHSIFKASSEKKNERWSGVVLAADGKASTSLMERLILIRFDGIPVKDLVNFYEEQWFKVPLFALGADWFLHTEGFRLFGNPIRLRIKRLIDLSVSSVLLVLTLPLMLLAFAVIKLESSGPAVFRQVRTGRDGKDFVLYKFRSMRVDAEASGAQWAAVNDCRVTRIGNFLRKTRIDELPQIFNILKGNMSMVGPRPERPEFNNMLAEKIPFYNFRHSVHPGLTGWAQVLYPYGASIEDAEEKLQYELFYIKNYSLWLDLSIALKTVQVVVFGKGR